MGRMGIKIGDDQTGNVLNKYVEQKPIQNNDKVQDLQKMGSLNAD